MYVEVGQKYLTFDNSSQQQGGNHPSTACARRIPTCIKVKSRRVEVEEELSGKKRKLLRARPRERARQIGDEAEVDLPN